MFEKLLSALPYNPSLIKQMAFYSKRLKEERSIRGMGLIFITLSMFIQFFAVFSPTQPTLADSPNDLLNGGFSTPTEAAQDCNNNILEYKNILSFYGISCEYLQKAPIVTLNSDSNGKQLYSMGRLPYDIPGESPVIINNTTYYARYLWGWDKPGTTSNYQALDVTKPGGQKTYILFQCGNITTVGFPTPPVAPKIVISKSTTPGYPAANSEVKAGSIVSWRIAVSNQGGNATNLLINDPNPTYTTPKELEISKAYSYGFNVGTSSAQWQYPKFNSGASEILDVKYTINSNTPPGTRICNTATATTDQTKTVTSDTVCILVAKTPPPPVITPPKQPNCELLLSSQNPDACISLNKSATNLTQSLKDANGTTAKSNDQIQYTLTATNQGTKTVKDFVFKDNLSYVLNYSQIINSNGGSLNKTMDISWPAININSGQTISKVFVVKVDSPIPSTPASTTDPNFFNLIMNNTYGNTIKINLPDNNTKVLQSAVKSLPNTGPGSSIIVALILVVVSGYFYYRSRILSEEVSITINERTGNQ